MNSKQRSNLKRKLRYDGYSEDEITQIINTATANSGEATKRGAPTHVEKQFHIRKRKNQ